MAATIAGLRIRALAYAERRLPALTRLRKPEALPIRLDRRRIYVLPTGFGLGFSLLLFVMLLGALNYANNPALLLTCLFGAAGGASLFSGFRAMNGLSLVRVASDECHAGTPLALHLRFAPSARARPSLRLRVGDEETAFALPAAIESGMTATLATTTRGWMRAGRLRVSTDYPLGLFHVWSWLNPDAEFLIYPAIEIPAPPLPNGDVRGDIAARAGAGEDHASLRDYRVTDAPRLIAWKASARHDMLLVRDAEQRSDDALVLDYESLHGLEHEARIRRLTAWVLAADAAQRDYILRLPGGSHGPAAGAVQRHACLRALALLPHA
ncbi:MAG TPA: DUF58 domain-containing protein [Rhodanobacteraceae bacterium]|nr:DUF58 domain-containing protein [Rhodanobacteraceae bacterium]